MQGLTINNNNSAVELKLRYSEHTCMTSSLWETSKFSSALKRNVLTNDQKSYNDISFYFIKKNLNAKLLQKIAS